MENNDLGPTIVTLKAEVDFLGEELTAAKAEIARLRAGGCARDQSTTQYCAEAAKLAAENERLRAALKNIRELNFTSDGWAHSDMIEQEIVFALAQGGKDE
jgi:cell division protein FtsB